MSRRRPPVILFAAALVFASGLVGCQYRAHSDSSSTIATESVYAMRDRSGEIMRELLVEIPDEHRATPAEEGSNIPWRSPVMPCREYEDDVPEGGALPYSYRGYYAVELRSGKEGRQAVDNIGEKLEHTDGWGDLKWHRTKTGIVMDTTSPDGFDVEVRLQVNREGIGAALSLRVYSPCFYPAESPWPTQTQI